MRDRDNEGEEKEKEKVEKDIYNVLINYLNTF